MVDGLSSEILEIYGEADAQTAHLSEATGLQCPPGCGRCCQSPKIMASGDPQLGYRVLPINQALREALEYLYWKRPQQAPKPETTEKLAS